MQNNLTDEQWAEEFKKQMLKALSDDEAGHLFHLAASWTLAGTTNLDELTRLRALLHGFLDACCDVQRDNLDKDEHG